MATLVGKVGMVTKGAWSSSATYEILDVVSYNGGLYIAKQAVPANTAPTNTTYWQNATNMKNYDKSKHFYAYAQTLEIDISDYLSNSGSDNYYTQILIHSWGGSGGVNNESYSLLALVNTQTLASGQTIEASSIILHAASTMSLTYNSTTHKLSITTNAGINLHLGAEIL